ncbi:MAG: hypothetical protein AB9869_17850 [Verrucomicrobiia bacterium]
MKIPKSPRKFHLTEADETEIRRRYFKEKVPVDDICEAFNIGRRRLSIIVGGLVSPVTERRSTLRSSRKGDARRASYWIHA